MKSNKIKLQMIIKITNQIIYILIIIIITYNQTSIGSRIYNNKNLLLKIIILKI
jgi:hypothetical protein